MDDVLLIFPAKKTNQLVLGHHNQIHPDKLPKKPANTIRKRQSVQ